MSEQEADRDAWTLYWQSDTLDSCFTSASESDRREIEAVWTELARQSATTCKVLDLATGNGTVAAALLRANSSLKITGVDMAAIDPSEFVSANEELKNIEFISSTNIEELPFSDCTFNLVTSQFGIEYASVPQAFCEAVRVLAPQGQLCFLIHHVDGEILKSVIPYKIELEALLHQQGLIRAADEFVKGRIALADLESAGQSYLDLPHVKTKRISERVFSVIQQLIVNSASRAANLSVLDELQIRLMAELVRLTALFNAAMNQEQIDDIHEQLQESSFSSIQISPFYLGRNTQTPALVAWLLLAKK